MFLTKEFFISGQLVCSALYAKAGRGFGRAFPWEKNVSGVLQICFGIIYRDFCQSELQILTVFLGSLPHYSVNSII